MGSEFQKINVGIKISILQILCVLIFRQNGQLWLFGPTFAQKRIFGLHFQKTTLIFFGQSLGKLPNYVQYFGSNIVEGLRGGGWNELGGGGWNWMELGEGGWRLVEAGARFSNMHFQKSLRQTSKFAWSDVDNWCNFTISFISE